MVDPKHRALEDRLRRQRPASPSAELKRRVMSAAGEVQATPVTALDRAWFSRPLRVAAVAILAAAALFSAVDERRVDARLARAFGDGRGTAADCLDPLALELGLGLPGSSRCYRVGYGEPPRASDHGAATGRTEKGEPS